MRSRFIVAVEKKYILRICVCVCVCIRASGRVGVCMRVRACSVAYPACDSYEPYSDGIFGSTIFFDILTKGTIF